MKKEVPKKFALWEKKQQKLKEQEGVEEEKDLNVDYEERRKKILEAEHGEE